MRDTIFIGHATPEDNEFTLWLQSKLQNEGYKCECDLSFLLGGEADYWKTLQEFLENNTIKYLLIVSNITFNKSGVLDEWEHCKSIEKENSTELHDFIIPIKIDKSSYNSRIGLNRKNIISFEDNWATGLKILLRKLIYDHVPKSDFSLYSINNWYENRYSNWLGINENEHDVFYSNWIKINQFPSHIYFYKFSNEKQAKAVLINNIVYPAFRHGNIIVTFQKKLEYYLSDKAFEIEPIEIISKKTEDVFQKYEDDEFPTFSDLKRLFVRLLKECFEKYLIGKNLLKFDLSNTSCFFYEYNENNKIKGRFSVNGKSKNIGVVGIYHESFWHYAISFNVLLFPELCFSLRNHLIFTDDKKTPWNDTKKMHKARRDKGKNMRNKEWRDQQLAFISSLAEDESNEIILPIAEDENIILSTTPILFNANFSYTEPNDVERLNSIDGYFEEEEFYIEENEI